MISSTSPQAFNRKCSLPGGLASAGSSSWWGELPDLPAQKKVVMLGAERINSNYILKQNEKELTQRKVGPGVVELASLLSAWWCGGGKPGHTGSPPATFLGRWISWPEGKREWLRRTEDPALWALQCLYLSVTQQTWCEDSPWGGRKGRERSHCPSSHDLVTKLGSLPLIAWLELPRKEENGFALPHHWDCVTCLSVPPSVPASDYIYGRSLWRLANITIFYIL